MENVTQLAIDHVEDLAHGEPFTSFTNSFADIPEANWPMVIIEHSRRTPDYISQWWQWVQRKPEFSGLVTSISARLPRQRQKDSAPA